MRAPPAFTVLLCALGAAVQAAPGAQQPAVEHLSHGIFQDVTVYRPRSGHIGHLVLFLSGEEGWGAASGAMAEVLARQGALVLGIDDRRFVGRLESAGGCIAPGGALQALSRYVRSSHPVPTSPAPLLAGYSAGATLAYAAAAGAPRGAFSGLLTLGFSAAITLREPLCREGVLRVRPGVAHGTYHLLPGGRLPVPWIDLTGTRDRAGPAPLAHNFVGRVPGAEIVLLPNVDHTFAAPSRWTGQLEAAFAELVRKAEAHATSFSTTLPRTCPLSSVRCASATSSSG